MNRQICVIVVFLAGSVMVFGDGFSISAGGGGIFGGVFTRYTLRADGDIASIDARQQMDQFDYGFFAFVDATYATLSFSFLNSANNWREPAHVVGMEELNFGGSGQGWGRSLGFLLMGRWPFTLNNRITVFPMLGVKYQIALMQRRTNADGFVYDRTDGVDEGEHDRYGNPFLLSDWNAFWINLGVGADFVVLDNFFIRGEFHYGFRLMTSHERKNLNLIRHETGDDSPRLGGLTSSPSLRISAGWQLFSR